MIEATKAGVKEIPIPGVVHVRTYGTDYLPVRRERNTYIRPKGELLSCVVLSCLLHTTCRCGASAAATCGQKEWACLQGLLYCDGRADPGLV